MRGTLIGIIVLEALALVALFGLQAAGVLEQWRRDPPPVPVFTIPLQSAVIGDFVRYQRLHPETGEVLGYLDYEILSAAEYEGSALGREFIVKLVKTDEGGGSYTKHMRIQPSLPTHGFLPPRFEEDDAYPPGARPVLKTITATSVTHRKRNHPGFLVEAVLPRRSLEEVKERYWMSPAIAVFGVARWERPDEILVEHHSRRHGS